MLCDKEKCTGCYACYNICPKNAIVMQEDEYGYIYPYIDKEKCVNCKMCEKVCPSLKNIKLSYPKKCYAMQVKDSNILCSSTSGGFATKISEKIIKENGVVYGAAYIKNCEVNHVRIDDVNELHRLQGSKYVHSYIKEVYKQVKQDLTNNKTVLFIGTPCQVAGLKKFLINEHKNLYTIDIICHGAPSQQYLKNAIKEDCNTIDVDRVDFRDKKYNEFTFSVKKDHKEIFAENWGENPYFYTFMQCITYRENCYECNYAKSERGSDITIGDFWGLKNDSKFYNDRNKGVSVLLPITNKGLQLIDDIKDEIEFEERNISEAVEGNPQLRHPAYKNKKNEVFKIKYKKNNRNLRKTYKCVFKKRYLKQKIKKTRIGVIIKYLKGKIKQN